MAARYHDEFFKEEIEVRSERSGIFDRPRLIPFYALIRRFPRPRNLFKLRQRVPESNRPIVDLRSRARRWATGTEETLSTHNENDEDEATADIANLSSKFANTEQEEQKPASTTSHVEASKPVSVTQTLSNSPTGERSPLSEIGTVSIPTSSTHLITTKRENRHHTLYVLDEQEAQEDHRNHAEEPGQSPSSSSFRLNSNQQSVKELEAQTKKVASLSTTVPTKSSSPESEFPKSLSLATADNIENVSQQLSDLPNGDHSSAPDSVSILNSIVANKPDISNIITGQSSLQVEQNVPPHFIPETSDPQAQMAMVPTFRLIGAGLYEATTIQPDERYQSQWSDMWKSTLNIRIKQLHLGPHVITNLRLCMVGPQPNERSMVPTILLVCPVSKRYEIETVLSGFVSLFNPPVELKIIGGRVKFASGSIGFPSKAGEKTGLLVDIKLQSCPNSLMGSVCRVRSPQSGNHYYPQFSIGGLILVGDSLYALSVSHSMFRIAKENDLNPGLSNHGRIAFYEWSGNEDDGEYSKSAPKIPNTSMDWMLIHTKPEFFLSNTFQSSRSNMEHQISGSWLNNELTDGKVWICAGVSGIQTGFLGQISSVLTYGQVNYDVLSIALEYPLEDGDSGSWVTRDDKICGVIFARLDGLPWAYMLPIENTFRRIAQVCTTSGELGEVKVPTLAKLQELKAGAPRRLSAETTNFAHHPAHQPPVSLARIPSPSTTLSDKEDDNFLSSRIHTREFGVTDIRLDMDIPPTVNLNKEAEEKRIAKQERQRQKQKDRLLSEQPTPLSAKDQTPNVSGQRLYSSPKGEATGSKLRRAFRKAYSWKNP